MSAAAVSWVYRYSPAKGAAFAVHVAIADSTSDDHDHELWMRVPKLATKARVSTGACRKAIAWLVEAGLLVVLDDGVDPGNGSATRPRRFLVELPDDLPVVYEHSSRRQREARAHDAGSSRPRREARAHGASDLEPKEEPQPEPKVEPLLSVPSKADVLAAGFEDFWSAYPRKTAKGTARKAWAQAVAKAGSIDVIVDGAARYAADPNRDDRFTAHASTWLNGERWGDPPLPPRTGRPVSQRYGPQYRLDEQEESRQRAQPAGRVTDL